MKKQSKQFLIAFLTLALLSLGVYFSLNYKDKQPNCAIYASQKSLILTQLDFYSDNAQAIRIKIEQCIKNKTKPYDFHYQASLKDLETSRALEKMFSNHKQKAIGIMGRGSISRDSKQYLSAALIGKQLAERDYVVVTGGGPGTMEAAHLGVWFAGRPKSELLEAIKLLSKSPKVNSSGYLQSAEMIKIKYPRVKKTTDIAIPSFVYGVSISTRFANQYASYFNNALREEMILILSKNGVILLPGGFGTLLELFIALEYNSDGIKTNSKRPIALYNSTFWKKVIGPELLNNLFVTDSIEMLLQYLARDSHQEIKKVY